MSATIVITVVVSIAVSALVAVTILYRSIGRREAAAELTRDTEEARVNRLQSARDYLRLILGPIPLSIAIHAGLLLLLILTVHVQRTRELITVNLESQAGSGGGGGGAETRTFDTAEVPVPDTPAPVFGIEKPAVVDTSQALGPSPGYVRSSGGIGSGRGGGIGSGYGRGMGAGFGGYIGELRRNGLDVVLVIDGTGSMNMIIGDVKSKMEQLIIAIHRLVPIARVGIVVYGGKGDPMQVQPLTPNAQKLSEFLGSVRAQGGGEWEEDLYGGVKSAVETMAWRPNARKVIVLVGDSPPRKEDFQPLTEEIARFREENGTLNTVDVSAEEHERYERVFWLKVHGEEPPKISPLPGFYQQTRGAFQMLANSGGGAMRGLGHDNHINQQVMILAFGEQWQKQVDTFARAITAPGSGR